MNAIQTLQFQDTQFNITDLNGKPWLRGLQVASALGYSDAGKAIAKLYDRNADEFTDSMTQIITLPDLNPQNGGAGQNRQVRVFSLRGCHLLGMLAKTAKAKEFRRWVLDILEAETEQADPTKINPAQKQQIRNAVKARVYRTGETFQAVYEKLHDLLYVNSYHEIQAKDFQTALNFLASIPNAPAKPEPKPQPEYINGHRVKYRMNITFSQFDDKPETYLITLQQGKIINHQSFRQSDAKLELNG